MRKTNISRDDLIRVFAGSLIESVGDADITPGKIGLYNIRKLELGLFGLVFVKWSNEFQDEIHAKTNELMSIEDDQDRHRQLLLWLSDIFKRQAALI